LQNLRFLYSNKPVCLSKKQKFPISFCFLRVAGLDIKIKFCTVLSRKKENKKIDKQIIKKEDENKVENFIPHPSCKNKFCKPPSARPRRVKAMRKIMTKTPGL